MAAGRPRSFTGAAVPDVILFHPKGLAGPHLAEKFSVPAMLVLPAPMLVPTGAFPLLGLPHLDHGPRFNRATYRLVTWSYRLYGRMLNRFRREELGLGPLPRSANVLSRADGRPVPVLHGYSPQVVPRPADWPPDAHVTGYWFLASADPWRPPAELAAFLAAGTPPVYVGFGSMAGRRPCRLARIVVEALRKTGHRGILATGWGGLESMHRPRTILKIRQAPHDWLFPRTAGVVHHGGAGTTAAGLRAGRPTLICPFIADQPFWGHRIHSLGLGPEPIPQRKLSAQALARSLRTLTGSDVIRDKAAAMGRRIRKENGIARAVEIIEKIGRHAAAD